MKLLLALLLTASMSAHAELQPRDFNRDGAVDAYFDTAQNLTWLADANYAGTVGFTIGHTDNRYVPGAVFWGPLAQPWVAGLNISGVTGWRQHRMLTASCSGEEGFRITCFPETTELSVLLSTGDLPFVNLQSRGYWSETIIDTCIFDTCAVLTGIADRAGVLTVGAFATNEYGPLFIWPVRDGDVSPIPEPGTWALMLAGLLFLPQARRAARNAHFSSTAGVPRSVFTRSPISGAIR